jgi:5,10-methylenetetrahydrofolate reductase
MVNGSPIFVGYVDVRSQKGMEKINEEVVTIPSTNDIEAIMSDPKKNKSKKSKMGSKQSVSRSLGYKVSLV